MVRNDPLRRAAAVALSAALVAMPLPAAAQDDVAPCLPNPNEPFIDNRDGYFVNYEEPPIHPLELSYDGARLYVTNLPDARVGVFDLANPGSPVLIDEIAVGLGPVTLRRRPPQTVVQPAPTEPEPAPASAPAEPAGAVAPLAAHRAGLEVEPVPITVRQLWVVCASSNALFIVDEVSRRVVDSVRLPHRPMGLVFDAAGDFAYVTLSDSNRIARVDADNPHAAPVYFEFDSEFPLGGNGARADVEEPRSLVRSGTDLYALSFLSGNGTTLKSGAVLDVDIENQWNFGPGNPAPPDRDVLHFDLAAGSPQGSAALWRMGTLNFDLGFGGPNGDLYVTTVDFRNEDEINEGEPQYRINSPILGSSFVVHALAHAAPSAAGTPQPGTVVVDLNDPANHAGTLHAGFRCAVPTDLLIAGNGRTAYIACHESRNVARVDLNSDLVTADFTADPATTAGFGIRGVALSPTGRWLYAYGRGDSTLLVFDTQNLPAGQPKLPNAVLPVGFDITPDRVLAGRFHFLDATNSLSGLATCNTCHMDGHLDGIAWDLSDFTGDIATDPKAFGRAEKGTKVTMSLLGIDETPPFHWRGDRADLGAFDPAFEGLLGGTRLDDPDDPDDPELEEFLAFVFSLSYPPNPHQNLDRSYTVDAEIGFDCFSVPPAHDVAADTNGGILSPTCETCHSMAGASATLNQVNNPIITLLSDDATQLRGLWDKTSDTVDFSPLCPGLPASEYCTSALLTRLPATGWGLANTGFVDSLIDFINLNVFAGLPAGSQPKIEQFVQQLDTGSAPTTAATHHLDGGLPAGPPYPSPVQELLDGAALGHNDLIVRGWIQHSGAPREIGMLYDPNATGGPAFTTDTNDSVDPGGVPTAGCTIDDTVILPGPNAIGPFTLAALDAMAGAGQAELALVGTPVGSGYRLGVDREMDCLRDGDEAAHNASPATAHSDGDRFPDGYEVRLGSLPDVTASVPTDTVAPAIPQAVVSWFNSNVLKARWTTDEEATSRIRVYEQTPFGQQLVYENDEEQFKQYHVMVARNLQPGRTYRVEVVADDPSGLQTVQTVVNPAPTTTTQAHLFESVHLASTTITHLGTNPNGTEQYRLEFHVVGENGQNIQGAEIFGGILEWNIGLGNLFPKVANPPPVTGPNGVATAVINGNLDFLGLPGVTEALALDVHFTNTQADDRLYFHSLDGQCGHWAQVGLYGGAASDPCP